MAFDVRPATAEDAALIIPWTTDTFNWGDYVPDRFQDWLEDEDSTVLVATVEGSPVALVHCVMLSATEGWLEAARVHPDHRRAGLGKALNRAGVEWARSTGARVVRLATEAANQPAIEQVEALGFRRVSAWAYCEWPTPAPVPAESGEDLRAATGLDVDVAWMAWSAGELSRAGRGLIAMGWQFRKATPSDLVRGVQDGGLYQSPAGWVLVDMPEERHLRVLWLATAPEDAPDLVAGLGRLASRLEADQVTIKVPDVPWMSEAIKRRGGRPSDLYVFEKGT